MESPDEKFDRLLKAIDELVGQEAAMIEAADYAAISEIQQRVEPLIAALVKLAPSIGSANDRARVSALLERRQRSIELLETRLAAAKAELAAVQRSTHQAARIAPVYGRAEGGPRPTRLRTSG